MSQTQGLSVHFVEVVLRNQAVEHNVVTFSELSHAVCTQGKLTNIMSNIADLADTCRPFQQSCPPSLLYLTTLTLNRGVVTIVCVQLHGDPLGPSPFQILLIKVQISDFSSANVCNSHISPVHISHSSGAILPSI